MPLQQFSDSPEFAGQIFDALPISVWIEDFSYPKNRIDMLRASGIKDFKTYFEEHPEFVRDCIEHTEVLSVNKETVNLTRAKNKGEILGPLSQHIGDESLPVYKMELEFLAEDRRSMEMELPAVNFHGTHLTIDFRMSLHTLLDGRTLMLISMIDITRRIMAERQLRASLEDKDVLLKEIHHRVKNNLALVSSLIQIFGANKRWKDVDEITNRIHAISRVHETIYRSDDTSRVDFGIYLQDIVSSLDELYDEGTSSVTVEAEKDYFFFNLTTAVPLGLILTELVTNARKHAFTGKKEPGTIRIRLDKDEGRCTLVVADNGRGLPAESTIDTTEHLGLTLIKALTEQIGGELTYTYKNGAVFTLSFPYRLFGNNP